MPMTAFRKGCMARFPSSTFRTSLSAVIRREKLIHMGRTKSIRMTGCERRPLVARK